MIARAFVCNYIPYTLLLVVLCCCAAVWVCLFSLLWLLFRPMIFRFCFLFFVFLSLGSIKIIDIGGCRVGLSGCRLGLLFAFANSTTTTVCFFGSKYQYRSGTLVSLKLVLTALFTYCLLLTVTSSRYLTYRFYVTCEVPVVKRN